ncbi:MAG: sugar phosphate isomerase/epimerase family protein [Terriglobia bacterium]
MPRKSSSKSVSRRNFLAGTGSLLAAAPIAARGASLSATGPVPEPSPSNPAPPAVPRKIPIGVFDTVYGHLSLDATLDKMSALGLEAVEIAVGGYVGTAHCPTKQLLEDPAKAREWKKKFDDRNIRIGAFSAHGNPVHPDPAHAQRDAESMKVAVLLAERMDVPVVVGFSGCPGGSPEDKTPNWATYGWPPDFTQILKWQWNEKVIPYWKEAAKFAREHGNKKYALEMHPNFVVYNPRTLMKLRGAAGEEIGANCDLSHLFWQGCDPIEVIHFLGKAGALYHAHMKDTLTFKENRAKYGVLNFGSNREELPEASETFRAVGYGHSAGLWKEIVRAYMDVDFKGIMSIENEDPYLPGEVGVERAAYVLKNVRAELLGGSE